jgi:hypothetical protein
MPTVGKPNLPFSVWLHPGCWSERQGPQRAGCREQPAWRLALDNSLYLER